MSLSNARSDNQGFTLIETLVIVVIIGILSAIATPSLLGMLNRNKVSNALDQTQGALQEAQREAIRKSQQCTVTLDTTNSKVTGSCLSTGTRTLPSGIAMVTNLTSSIITFSFRGNTTNSGTIVVYDLNDSNQQKRCLVISNGLGVMRAGKYSGSTTTISADDCNTSS